MSLPPQPSLNPRPPIRRSSPLTFKKSKAPDKDGANEDDDEDPLHSATPIRSSPLPSTQSSHFRPRGRPPKASDHLHRPVGTQFTVTVPSPKRHHSKVEEVPVISDLSPQFKRAKLNHGPNHHHHQPPPPAFAPASPTRPAKPHVHSPVSLKPSVVVPAPGQPRRGRPKGWRPGLSYAALRAAAPHSPHHTALLQSHQQRYGPAASAARSTRPRQPIPIPQGYALPKRRGRPPKAASPPPRALYERSRPQFLHFQCEWKGCKAELHNVETLRRHVAVVHAKGESMVCQWAKCAHRPASTVQETDSRDDRGFTLDVDKAMNCFHGEANGSLEFDTGQALLEHVDKAHLIPLQWHCGDGPQNTSASNPPRKHHKPAAADATHNTHIPRADDSHTAKSTPEIRQDHALLATSASEATTPAVEDAPSPPANLPTRILREPKQHSCPPALTSSTSNTSTPQQQNLPPEHFPLPLPLTPPDYLFDKNGVQVTPSIRDQQIEDFLTLRNNRRKLKELLLRVQENAPSETDSTTGGAGEESTT